MNMKRFIIEPVVIALGWLSFGIGSALSRVNQKVMSRNADIRETLNLGPAKSGDRWYYMVTCAGQCREVIVTVEDPSGSPNLFVAEAEPPLIRWGCRNCNCIKCGARRDKKCELKNLNSTSFGIVVQAESYLSQATLKVEAGNMEGVQEIPIHSYSWDSLEKGEIRNISVTCNGTCKYMNVWVRGTSPEEPNGRPLVTRASQIPNLFLAYDRSDLKITGQYCKDCFFQSSGNDVANLFAFELLYKGSFVASVSSDRRIPKNVQLSVVGLNVKRVEEL